MRNKNSVVGIKIQRKKGFMLTIYKWWNINVCSFVSMNSSH